MEVLPSLQAEEAKQTWNPGLQEFMMEFAVVSSLMNGFEYSFIALYQKRCEILSSKSDSIPWDLWTRYEVAKRG